MENSEKLKILRGKVGKLYNDHKETLLFHGWHHINFVLKKALEFADSINCDKFVVESTVLVHDLNFIVEVNSEPEAAKGYRSKLLQECGYTPEEIGRIEKIVMESHTGYRSEIISEEGKAVSDADTLFKALPTTPILFSSKYITQNKVDIYKWAEKVTSEQIPLMEKDIYFYTDLAKERYLKWAKDNLQLCMDVKEALEDPDVKEMLDIAKNNGII